MPDDVDYRQNECRGRGRQHKEVKGRLEADVVGQRLREFFSHCCILTPFGVQATAVWTRESESDMET